MSIYASTLERQIAAEPANTGAERTIRAMGYRSAAHREGQLWADFLLELGYFAAAVGHTAVPYRYVSPSGHSLGRWVSVRRAEKRTGVLPAERIAELEQIPAWTWDIRDAKWSIGVTELRRFVAAHGHAAVPLSYSSETGHLLGAWVSERRSEKKSGALSPERIVELEQIPGWVWDASNSSADGPWWVNGIAELTQFAAVNGHTTIPDRYVSESGFRLGRWVRRRRGDKRKGTLAPDQIRELERAPGWVW